MSKEVEQTIIAPNNSTYIKVQKEHPVNSEDKSIRVTSQI
jgi:hypothetical protein